MSDMQALEQRINELEIKASFAEDLVEELNLTIYRQQQQIDQLVLVVAELRKQQPDGGTGGARSLLDERPPHY